MVVLRGMKEEQIQIAKEVPITKVLERLNIPYETVGGNAKIICPFHDERNKSMTIYDDHYHCYGCNEHGDSIAFVEKILGLSFKESVELLILVAQGK